MAEVKVGVVGVGRGKWALKYCGDADNAQLVAICDCWEEELRKTEKEYGTENISYYTDYDAFLRHDMDVVVLANYATEHAPFAIKAMRAGKDVVSEVLPVQTMAQAVELIECIERTGRKYCYAENYCFMNAPYEMRRKYRAGELGTFEYGEGEYMHNCESGWHELTRGDRNHWRNRMSAFNYCTHSVGPLLHITGMRPVKVTGFELPHNARMARMGAAAGSVGIEMVTLENGAVIKSLHGVGCSKNSIWYSIYGSKGRMESAREDTKQGDILRLYTNLDPEETRDGRDEAQNSLIAYYDSELAQKHGHGGSDYYCLHNAFAYMGGDENADVIDVYEALDMWMCGHFGYLSVLNGGIPMDIPDMRDRAVREQYRHDNRCTDPNVAGEQYIAPYSKGELDIPDSVYEWHKKAFAERRK